MALGAGCGCHALLQLLPGGIGLGLPIASGNIVQDSLKGLLQHSHAVAPVIGHVQLFRAGAVENHLHGLFGKGIDRIRQGEMVFLGQSLEIHPENGVRPGTLPAGSLNGPVKNGLRFVRDYQVLIRNQLKAKARTIRAGTVWIVEGEHPRLQLRQADAAVLAGVVLGKTQLLVLLGQLDGHKAPGMGAGRFNRVRQAAAQPLLQHQTVHHQLNGVLPVLFQLDLFRQVVENAVCPHPGEALLPGILQNLHMLALFAPNHRGQHHETSPLPQSLHPVHNLVDGLAADLLAALGAVGDAHPGPEQTQVVIYFRYRAHCRPGAFGRCLLVNGNSGRQAVNGIHIRLVHLAQKLPGIGTQALHISPLSLGIDGIKGQTGFTGPAEAGKDHHFISWDLQIHVFQVVFPGAPDNDLIVHRLPRFSYIS